MSGENNPMYGKKRPEHSKRMSGENNPNYGKTGKNSPLYGIHRSTNTIQKMRASALNRVEKNIKNGGQITPRYNPDSILCMDALSMYNDWQLQHAENGGEVRLPINLFPDGFDKINNIVAEYYERAHYNSDGTLNDKTLKREQEIIDHLGCTFIRIHAFDKNNIRFEMIN